MSSSSIYTLDGRDHRVGVGKCMLTVRAALMRSAKSVSETLVLPIAYRRRDAE